MLHITVAEARNLVAKDKSSKYSDPYVVLQVNKAKYKTSAKKKTLNPTWNETFELKGVNPNDDISIEVWDKDTFKDDFMGHAKVKVRTLMDAKSIWLKLEAKDKGKPVSGEVRISIDGASENTKQTQSANDKKEKEQQKALSKTVRVVEEDFPALDESENSIAYSNVHDRTIELRKLAGVPKAKRCVCSNKSFLDDTFFQIVSKIRPSIRMIRLNTQKLREVYGLFFAAVTDNERDELSAQISTLTASSNKELSSVPLQLKELEKLSKKTSSSREQHIKKNVFVMLSKAFADAIMEFKEAQNYYELMHKKTVRRLYTILLIAFRRMPAKPNATEEELKEVEVLSVSDVLEGVVDPKHQKAKEALAYIKRRHRDIVSVERSLHELREMFQQLALLVAEQVEFIDRIEANITNTREHVKQGLIEIKKSRYYQKHKFKITPVQLNKLYK